MLDRSILLVAFSGRKEKGPFVPAPKPDSNPPPERCWIAELFDCHFRSCRSGYCRVARLPAGSDRNLSRPAYQNASGQGPASGGHSAARRRHLVHQTGRSLAGLETHEAAFNDFLHSIQFPDKAAEPITWKTPPGWERLPGNAFRYATLRFGPPEAPLEVTISKLGREGGAASVQANVNRWRHNDLGLPPITEAELPTQVQEEKIGGVLAIRVDMRGPGKSEAVQPAPEVQAPSLRYTKPEGWEPLPTNQGAIPMAAAFRVQEGQALAKITVMSLEGAGGGELANVSRWPSKSTARLSRMSRNCSGLFAP